MCVKSWGGGARLEDRRGSATGCIRSTANGRTTFSVGSPRNKRSLDLIGFDRFSRIAHERFENSLRNISIEFISMLYIAVISNLSDLLSI